MTPEKLHLSVSGDGLVTGLSYHDANLVGLQIDPSRAQVRVGKGNTEYALIFEDVFDFTITDFWFGAIIADVRQWPLSESPRGIPDFGLGHMYGNRASGSDFKIMCERVLNRLPTAILVQIDCSYGGMLSIVCGSLHAEGASQYDADDVRSAREP